MPTEFPVLDIACLPQAGGQWANLHPMERARVKRRVFPHVLAAVRRADLAPIDTPCIVNVQLYCKGRAKVGLDFDNLCILIGKLFLDVLCPDKFERTKNGIRHRVGLNLIPDDTIDHIRGIVITKHLYADRNHTVLSFEPPGERLRQQWAEASEAARARQTRRRAANVNSETS